MAANKTLKLRGGGPRQDNQEVAFGTLGPRYARQDVNTRSFASNDYVKHNILAVKGKEKDPKQEQPFITPWDAAFKAVKEAQKILQDYDVEKGVFQYVKIDEEKIKATDREPTPEEEVDIQDERWNQYFIELMRRVGVENQKSKSQKYDAVITGLGNLLIHYKNRATDTFNIFRRTRLTVESDFKLSQSNSRNGVTNPGQFGAKVSRICFADLWTTSLHEVSC